MTFDEVYLRVEDDLRKTKKPSGPNIELSRYAALVGFIDFLQAVESEEELRKLARLAYRLGPPPDAGEIEAAESPNTGEQDDLLLQVYQQAKNILRPAEVRDDVDQKGIYLINLNRAAAQSLFESRATVKADAAHNLFAINTTGIAFAIIDGGIDATHPAFLRRSDKSVTKLLQDSDPSENDYLTFSRVLQTYDFTLVRDIVAKAVDKAEPSGPNKKLIEHIFEDKENETALAHLKIRCNSARDLDWEILCPLIRIPHTRSCNKSEGGKTGRRAHHVNGYRAPGTDHGTHVAGILAADFPNDPDTGRHLIGMCPQLSLYDLRVLTRKAEAMNSQSFARSNLWDG